MTLHELVDEYVHTWQTLQSFTGHIDNKKEYGLQFCDDFENLFAKFKTLGRQIIKQYRKETNSLSVFFEMERATHPDLDDASVRELTVKEMINHE